jgi:nucleotide-binding universal stress UspA family protein
MPAGYPRRILCAVDFSDHSKAAARTAATLARASGGTLYALHAHAIDAPVYFTPEMAGELSQQSRHSAATLHRTLEQFVRRESGGYEADCRIAEGDPVTAILTAATDLDVDLIVVGTRAATGLARLVVGSVAGRVLHRATAPVLTVRATDTADSIREILCPVDDSELSKSALHLAARLSVTTGAHLAVLHVREPGATAAAPDVCGWLGSPELPGCRMEEITRSGRVDKEILAAAGELSANLIIMGARHRLIGDETVLGSTTAWLMKQAPCPIVTVTSTEQVEESAA